MFRFLFLTAIALLSALPASADHPQPLIRIGAVLPLSGGLAHLGTSYRDAMRLAVSDIPGASRYRYELLFEDDQGQLAQTATAARKLLDVDKVAAIVSMWSNQGNVVGPLAASKGVPHFACAWDKSVSRHDTTFNLSATPDTFMKDFVQEMERRNIRTFQLIELNDSGSISAHDQLEKQLRSSSVKMISREQFNSGTADFRALLTRLKAQDADALYINAGSPELELIAQQARQIGILRPFLTIGCFDFAADLSPFEGAWYMTMTWPNDGFIQRYRKQYGRDIVYQLGNFHDMISILIQAFEATYGSSGAEKSAVVHYLKSLKEFRGVLGRLTQDSERAFQSTPVFLEIKDGKRVILP